MKELIDSIDLINMKKEDVVFDGLKEFTEIGNKLNNFSLSYLKSIDKVFPKETLTFKEDGNLSDEDIIKIDEFFKSDEGKDLFKFVQEEEMTELLVTVFSALVKLVDNTEKVKEFLLMNVEFKLGEI